MPLRILALLSFVALGLAAFVTAVPASAQQAPVKPQGQPALHAPARPLSDLRDVTTFSWKMHRELSGPAGQRVFDIYKDNFKAQTGLIPDKLPANGIFTIDWDGAMENPTGYVQNLSVGKNVWVEWVVGKQARAQYNSQPVINLNNVPRNEMMTWWDGFAQWLSKNNSELDCDSTPRVVNGEQSIRCIIPSLTQEAKIDLADTMGIYAEENTMSVSNMLFAIWVTKADTIPLKLDLEMTIVDARNNKSTGKFQIDIFDIEDPSISVDLP